MDPGASGNAEVVPLWVASGANVDAEDVAGRTPLFEASRKLFPKCVAALLRLGADARHADRGGSTALHVVAAKRLFLFDPHPLNEVVRLLIAAGCDPAARDPADHTALDVARMFTPLWYDAVSVAIRAGVRHRDRAANEQAGGAAAVRS